MSDMARISIYVPDDLKAEMDAVGDAVNWSDAARTVFQRELADYEHRTERTHETAIKRLRASKRYLLEGSKEGGRQLGEAWARDCAEYWELKSLARLDLPSLPYDGDVFDVVREFCASVGETTYEDDWQGSIGSDEVSGGPIEPPNRELIKSDPEYRDGHNEFVHAWAAGAAAFYNSVKDKL